MSIDQLTEEAEADLANNNDPNNNSSTNANEDYANNANDQVNTGPTASILPSSATTPSSASTAAEGDQSSQSFEIENLYPTLIPDNFDATGIPNANVDETDSVLEAEDPFQAALERDISLILKLMPDKAYDEVRCMLESHQENPSRVQVRSRQRIV